MKSVVLFYRESFFPKLKDAGHFIISYSIGSYFSSKELCDLPASINLMSLFIYKRLGLREVKPTIMKLQLTDRSYIFPMERLKTTSLGWVSSSFQQTLLC